MGDGAHAIVLLAPDIKQLPLLQREVDRQLPAEPRLVALDWERLKMKPGFGPKKLREIVELFTLAAGR